MHVHLCIFYVYMWAFFFLYSFVCQVKGMRARVRMCVRVHASIYRFSRFENCQNNTYRNLVQFFLLSFHPRMTYFNCVNGWIKLRGTIDMNWRKNQNVMSTSAFPLDIIFSFRCRRSLRTQVRLLKKIKCWKPVRMKWHEIKFCILFLLLNVALSFSLFLFVSLYVTGINVFGTYAYICVCVCVWSKSITLLVFYEIIEMNQSASHSVVHGQSMYK